nr:DUF4153 domain-containing protein [Tissierella sp.]
MDNLRFTIEKIFKGAGRSFSRFPAAILSAIIISITAIVRIRVGWEAVDSYSLLLNSLQISFLLGAVFSMAAVALAEVRYSKQKSSFLIANISGLVVAIITFLLVYFYGRIVGIDGVSQVSDIAMARVSSGVFISIVAFIYIVSKAKWVDSFSDAFFITHRAFIISAIYGFVIMIGTSGVVGAFQALVYRALNPSIYEYIGVIVGFLTYTIFLGYFPSFKPIENKEEVERIEEQPRFIYVLFEYILVPILMALTVVLLIWSLRVVLKGVDVSFNQLSGIASSYVIIGIWIHIMVANHHSKLAEFYKRAYPFAGILILIFEAWALFEQINKFGLKTAEYSFLMIWIFAMISVLLLIVLKDKSYRKIAIAAMVLAAIYVLPIVGYRDITFNSQVNRLEDILNDQGLLVDNKIQAKDGEIEYKKRGEITNSVDFIWSSQKKNTPAWFKGNLNDEEVFRDTFGFEKTYGVYDGNEGEYFSTNLNLKEGPIDISGYNLSLNIRPNEQNDTADKFEGKAGSYEINITNESTGLPTVLVKLNGEEIIEENLSQYIEELLLKYPLEEREQIELPFEDMSKVLEDENIAILLVFSNININDQNKNKKEYYLDFQGIYVREKE